MNPALSDRLLNREQPGRIASGVMALLVHVVFFALLFFGVNWQQRPPEPVVAELWSSLPPVTKPQPRLEVVPPPPAPPVVKPEPLPPKPEPKVETKATPEPKPTIKPDIALEKEKQEKAKREREQKEKLDQKKRDEAKAEQKKLQEEREKADTAKREALEKQKLAALERDRAATEAVRARLEKEQNEAIQKLAQQQAAAQSKEVDGFKSRIETKVKRFVAKGPCSSIPDAEILLEMKFFPDGNLIGEPAVRKSSGSAACDEAVRRAVVLAQPLPLPPPGHPLLSQFVNPNLRFKPNE